VYIHNQLDGAEAGDDSSGTDSDYLTMLPASILLRKSRLRRNTQTDMGEHRDENEHDKGKDKDSETGNVNENHDKSDSSNDALTMLLPKVLKEKLQRKRKDESQ